MVVTPSDDLTKRASRQTLLAAALATLVILGLFTSGPAIANHPAPQNASQINALAGSRTAAEVNLAAEIVGQINNERSARGLPALAFNQYGANVAFSNSFHNRASGCTGNECHMTAQEWDVAYANGPPFLRAENVTGGPFYTSTGDTTRAFMNSDIHRWNILLSSPDLVGIGVACTADGGMWVTHQFLVSSVARFEINDPSSAPPASPVVTLQGAGSRCPAPPSAPTGVGASAGDASATVTWTAPSNTGGSPVTGYVVTPYVGATPGTPRSFASTATAQTITGLTNGTTYTFKVAATNAAGTGPQSTASNSVTPRTVPAAPTGVGASAGDGSATVTWTAPTTTGGSPVTGYVVTPFVGATPGTPRSFASTATAQTIAGLTNGTTYTFKVAATNAAGTGPQSTASNGVTPRDLPAYVPLSPARLMDTRPGAATADMAFAGGGAVAGGSIVNLTVTGRGGVPATGVGAVVLNVTAVAPSAGSHLTVWPAGAARPNASNLNFVPGQTVPNLVIAKVGTNGQVSVRLDAGSTHLAIDVAGWFPTGGEYVSLSPARLMDTRPGAATADMASAGGGAVAAGSIVNLTVTGRGGVPATGVGAVVLNVTAVAPSAGSHLTVWPAGAARPNASNLNFVPGQTVPNLVIAKVGTNGQVSVRLDAGSTHLAIDVAGWFPTGGEYVSLSPARLMDTRPGAATADMAFAGGGAVAGGSIVNLTVTGRGGVPATGVGAVVLNVTAVGPTAGSHLTVWPAGAARPNASNLNFAPGQTVPNLVIAKVGTNGQVSVRLDAGSTHLAIDVAGWFADPE